MNDDESCRVCGGVDYATVTTGIRDWEYGVDGVFDQRLCKVCGIVQLEPFPKLEDLRQAYEVPYHGYAVATKKGLLYRVLFRANEWRLQRRLGALVPQSARLLDIGCGTGQFLAGLKFLRPGACDGVDFSPVAVAAARRNGVEAVHGVFLAMQPPDRPYDVLFMNNYLEHTLEPLAELAHAKRFLVPGGRLLGELPNFNSVDRRVFGPFWGGNHVPRHTFQFTPSSLSHLLDQAGFREVRVRYEMNTGHWALSVQNFLQRNKSDLSNNPALRDGRAGFFGLLLILFLPLNAVLALLHLSSVIRFEART